MPRGLARPINRARDPAIRRAEERLEKLRKIREETEAFRREQVEEQQKRLEMELEKPSDQVAE